ncbi:hypothetical protein GCM10022225_83460 [Plantactinospora mayteni]|uniref:Uncharacterized protein n=1 Tax=Plantactinospora mayteni TaxID=566021 RepID=A0ABQ4F4D1_9ACTN|nr:hypothetical protein [Plantactinospora mayteni]GIH01769.1 hypothetical protein Pma05_83410 [Plantactinospora mayteni]
MTAPKRTFGDIAANSAVTLDTGSQPHPAGPGSQRRHIHRTWLMIVTAVLATVAGIAVTAAPAQAAYPRTFFGAYDNYTKAEGTFVWYNRSVQVGGGVWGAPAQGECAAVVFTAYDQHDRQVARAARPGDNVYQCGGDRYGYGFTLDASNVVGGIRKIEINLYTWIRNSGLVFLADVKVYHRPS